MNQTPIIATVGEILVEFVSHNPNCGLSRIGEFSGPYPSGAPAIFLDQAARMGASTEMIGGVGDDGFGRIVLRRLGNNNVGTRGVAVDPEHSTGVAFVSYYDDGSRDFVFHLSNTAADNFLVPEDLLEADKTILHISGSSLANPLMREAILTTIRKVITAGGKISCDPNARPELMRDRAVRDALTEVMNLSTYLMPSASDLEFLFPGLHEDTALETLLTPNTRVIAIKRGAAGATVIGDGARHEFAGCPVREVDPTGAGDCFCGTFIALLAQGTSLYDAGRQANAAGALAVTKRGPMEGNSGPAEITAFLDRHESETFT